MARQLVLPEDEMERKAGALKAISLGLAAAAVIAEISMIIIWLIDRTFPVVTITVLVVVALVIASLTYGMARAGRARFAAYFLVFVFSMEMAMVTLLLGGATGPLAITYIFPILVAGIVLGTAQSFIIATAVAVFYLVMIPVGQTGIIMPVLAPAAGGQIVPFFVSVWVIFFYLVAFLSWFAAARLNGALQGIRRYAAELQAANEKLQVSEEELRTSNEELEATNEELRASEEELRASNEELEASNEELKEAQEQLVRSEKLAAIGQLAGGVGHELRNPLGAIKNAVYYIRGKIAKNELAQQEPRVMEFLDIVDDEINSSNKIINDLLNFSRVGKPAVSPARIEGVIEDAIRHTLIPAGVELHMNMDTSLAEIMIDSDQVRQVLVNIATNAVQAMPDGGHLTIKTGEKDGFMEIEVSDTGHGIAGENIGRIFDPLYTMKAKGIGLGLAVCKSIVERHGGDIGVESEVGKGTTFTVRLPLNNR